MSDRSADQIIVAIASTYNQKIPSGTFTHPEQIDLWTSAPRRLGFRTTTDLEMRLPSVCEMPRNPALKNL